MQPMKGILLVVLATLAFAAADVITKQQAMRHPVSVVVAVRYLVNLGLLTVFLGPRLGARLWRTERRGLVLVRGLCLALASLTMGFALRLMPVGETVAIIYLSPFAVMLLAIPLLGERVGPAGWTGAALGFLGVLLIVRPGGGLAPLGVAFALVNAGFATAYHLLTRYLAHTESTIALLYQTALVGSGLFCLLALGSLDGLSVGAVDLAMMALLGALSTLGHFLFTAAYREAPASLLAPVNYLHLFWAGGLGWLIFGHLPDGWSLAGMALVCASGVMVAVAAYARPGQ
jgi:drug/metabolite transporter (DMT)-like permease